MNDRKKSGWFSALKIGVVLISGIAAAHIASEAAFPDVPAQSLNGETAFFQEIAQPEVTTRTQGKVKPTKAALETSLIPTPQSQAPATDAASYIVADIKTGQIFAAKNPRTQLPIASISKLMTAVIANETLVANETVTISDRAVATYGAAGGLLAGDELTVDNLFYPLLLESSNDAAEALAETESRAIFLNQMNRKASALDMTQTQFRDASGLSAGNVSSASDLLTLSQYIFTTKPFIFNVTTQRQATTPSASAALSVYTSNNPMVGRAQYIGGKNGYTDEARHTLLSLFSVAFPSGRRPVAIIVLGSETHVTDTMNLLRWIRDGV